MPITIVCETGSGLGLNQSFELDIFEERVTVNVRSCSRRLPKRKTWDTPHKEQLLKCFGLRYSHHSYQPSTLRLVPWVAPHPCALVMHQSDGSFERSLYHQLAYLSPPEWRRVIDEALGSGQNHVRGRFIWNCQTIFWIAWKPLLFFHKCWHDEHVEVEVERETESLWGGGGGGRCMTEWHRFSSARTD